MNSELKKHLIILGFKDDIQEVPTIKVVFRMWRITARKCHPDKPGGNKEEFQKVQNSLHKAGEIIKEITKSDVVVIDDEEIIARKLFEEVNKKKENTNSYTIFIEEERTFDWNSVLTGIYGECYIPNQNESNGRHWNHQDFIIDGISSKISITLWMKPKDKKPKLLIQSSKHLMTLMWVTNELPNVFLQVLKKETKKLKTEMEMNPK